MEMFWAKIAEVIANWFSGFFTNLFSGWFG